MIKLFKGSVGVGLRATTTRTSLIGIGVSDEPTAEPEGSVAAAATGTPNRTAGTDLETDYVRSLTTFAAEEVIKVLVDPEVTKTDSERTPTGTIAGDRIVGAGSGAGLLDRNRAT